MPGAASLIHWAASVVPGAASVVPGAASVIPGAAPIFIDGPALASIVIKQLTQT